MTILYFTGFGWGTSAPAQASSGTTAISSTTYKSPPYSLRINPATTATGFYNLGMPSATGTLGAMGQSGSTYHRFWFYIAALPSATEIIASSRQTGAEKITVRLNSTGTLGLYDNTGTLVGNGSTVLATTTWYFIEFMATPGATTSAASLWVNNNLEVSSSTVAQGTGTCDYLRLGKVANTNGSGFDCYYDNPQMGTTQGEAYQAQVAEIHPDADTSPAQWTAGTAPSNWTSVDNIPNNTTNYIQSTGSAGEAHTVSLDSLATAGYASPTSIYSVFSGWRAADAITGTSSVTCATKSGSTVSSLGAKDFTTGDTSTVQISNTDPATTAAWTETAVNAIELRITEANTPQVRCFSMIGEVLLSPAAGFTGQSRFFAFF
jgi:hypothetical protein